MAEISAKKQVQLTKDEQVRLNKDEFLSILTEMESTEVEYKIRMAIHRLRALVDRINA